jgi:hypothetical protein
VIYGHVGDWSFWRGAPVSHVFLSIDSVTYWNVWFFCAIHYWPPHLSDGFSVGTSTFFLGFPKEFKSHREPGPWYNGG